MTAYEKYSGMKAPTTPAVEERMADSMSVFFRPVDDDGEDDDVDDEDGHKDDDEDVTNSVGQPPATKASNHQTDHVEDYDQGHLVMIMMMRKVMMMLRITISSACLTS